MAPILFWLVTLSLQVTISRRKLRLLLVPPVVAIVCAMATVQTGAAATSHAGCTAAPAGFVGMVAEDVLVGSARYRTTQLAAMRAAGVTLLRQVFDWSLVERRRGHYDFSAYDSFVADAAKDGIQVMPILFNEPTFRSARPKHSKAHGTYPPRQLGDIAAFAAAAVRWYGPQGSFWKAHPTLPAVPIRSWEIWNEPNLNVYWLPHASATAYAAMLSSASHAIRTLDPGAEIVSAGLPLSKLPGVSLLTYITQLLHAGAASSLSTLAINAYSPTPAGVLALLTKIRRTLDAAGATSVALRITEFGWSDSGPGSQYRLGTKGQAAAIAAVIPALASARTTLNLRGFVYYGWRDAKPYAGAPDFWGLHTGLLNLRGKAKSALRSFSAAANALCAGG
jgi:hypothetical protein